ncbi:MAG: tRNA (adenosine(37)-N6)-threonylcarbamoyltransferase complex dimerization subunit type 1 TsaB [Gemmatimonadota bacterium]
MLILGLDTSTRSGSLALGRAGAVIADVRLDVRTSRSEGVLPGIDRALGAAGASAADLDAVVVASGPGSFTGVRVGAAVAKGLCFATGADLFAYSTLAAVASLAPPAPRVCALLDARGGRVYAAGYATAGRLTARFEPEVVALERLLARLEPVERWSFAGDVGPFVAEIRAAGGSIARAPADRSRAAALLALVDAAPEAGRVPHPRDWEPAYVAAPAAEREEGW